MYTGFPAAAVVKNLPASAGDSGNTGAIPWSGSSPRGGNGNPPVFCSGKFQGQRSLAGHKDWDTTEH